MLRPWLALPLVTALCGAAAASPPVRCTHYFSRATPDSLAAEVAKVRSALEGNHFFVTDRTLLWNRGDFPRTYLRELGSSLVDRLRGLGSEHRWLDVGAGEALAMLQYLLNSSFPHKAELTAIAVSIPLDVRTQRIQAIAPSFRYLVGRIEDARAEELGEFDLITDVYGALAYSHDVSATLRAEISRLRVGGTLMASGLSFTRFLHRRSSPNWRSYDHLTHWLADTSTGLTVSGDLERVIVTRNAREFTISNVPLVAFRAEVPPRRAFLAPRTRSSPPQD